MQNGVANPSNMRPVQAGPETEDVFKSSREERGVGSSNLSRRTIFPATHCPESLTRIMCDAVGVRKSHRVLEPSAGTGGMVNVIREYSDNVVAVELASNNYNELSKIPRLDRYKRDFLRLTPDNATVSARGIAVRLGRFDRIIMCPPKDSVAHIEHAIQFLTYGGKIMALVQDQNISDIGDRPWTVVKPPKEFEFEYGGTPIPCSLVLYAEMVG